MNVGTQLVCVHNTLTDGQHGALKISKIQCCPCPVSKAGRQNIESYYVPYWSSLKTYTEQIGVKPKMKKLHEEKTLVLTSLSLSSPELPVAAIKEGSGWSDVSHPSFWLALLKQSYCVSWHFSQHRARRRDGTQVVLEASLCADMSLSISWYEPLYIMELHLPAYLL